MIKVCAVDFETEEILPRPHYPPVPVGAAITYPSGKSEYLSWGHPTQNNCTKAEAKRKLKNIYNEYAVVFHNAKFDLEVGNVFLGLPMKPKHGWHCTLLLAFLFNPRAWSLKLKPLADKYLSMPPIEQDKLKQWVFDNVKGGKQAKSKWGKFISLTPGKLCGVYAKGDTIRTLKLFKMFYKHVKDNGMLPQYDVERGTVERVLPMEQVGITIDVRAIEPELKKAKKAMAKHERAMIKIVGDINFNSAPQKIEAFERLGLVKEWEYGEPSKKTGQVNPKTGIESLLRVCVDKKLVRHLDMFSKYSKLIGTYMQPWLDSALENDGKFFPWFNTIKGDNDKGTYTGRFSSNFQQVPREPQPEYKTLPFLRNFILPDKKSHILFNRDFMGQELRILGHFGNDVLLNAYNENPLLDGHKFVIELVREATGVTYPKAFIKGCNFLMVYGGGAPALSNTLKIPLDEAKVVMAAHSKALPEVKNIKDELKYLDRHDEKFKTAGGRWYDFEYGKEYVALNTLIQGSAADHAKRALINIDNMLKSKYPDARINLCVHDEFMISGDKRQQKKLMKDFKAAMEYDELFDLPMLTDGKIGHQWGDMAKCKE